MSGTTDTDGITRSVVISAPRERVWRALSNAEEFGAWFGVNFKGQTFAPGRRARGHITMAGYEHHIMEILVERVDPPDLLSYRWHPYALEKDVDYSKEQPTLVTFTLADAPGNGTLLTAVESGFDNVPQHRRNDAFRMNSTGWEEQMRSIVKHLGA
jgi:uncharacterized protein YndB with AHSA1/START domain